MNKGHIAEQVALNKCIQMCEGAIDACQMFIDMCSTTSQQECAQAFGITMRHCKENIIVCKEVLASMVEHKKQCTQATCTQVLDELITACQNCIDTCQECVTTCHVEQDLCMESCLQVIDACNECAQVCEKTLEL